MPSRDSAVNEIDSETVSSDSPESALANPDLARIVAAWPTLPEAVRASILAMVKAADGGEIE